MTNEYSFQKFLCLKLNKKVSDGLGKYLLTIEATRVVIHGSVEKT